MWNKGTIMGIATFILGNGVSAGLQITGIINPVLGWTIIVISTIISILLFIYAFRLKSQLQPTKDDGTTLLRLLDESYQRLKLASGLTIQKLRERGWGDMDSSFGDMLGLTQIDVNAKIQSILEKGLTDFVSGNPLTVSQDAEQLGSSIKKSPLFTTDPEIVAKDASIIIRDKIPYLNKAMKHYKYGKIIREIEHERDGFPSKSVSNSIDAYLDHSIKINSGWIMAERDLDGMRELEEFMGQRLPLHFTLQLKNLPNQMDTEMGQYRNDVAIAISDYIKGVKQ